VVTTITVYADPASLGSLAEDDALFSQLLRDSGGLLPGFSIGDTGSATPEPATFLALGAGLLVLGVLRRKRT
jgi:hypothetical protein